MRHIGLTTGQAAKYLGLHPKTVQDLDRRSVLKARRTATNRRWYTKVDLDAYIGMTRAEVPRRIVAYCRVSSAAQRPDLKTQRRIVEEFCLKTARANVEYIEEIGGGLNFKRRKFLDLLSAVEDGEVAELIVAHNDRLARFGFDYLAARCQTRNCVLTVINTEKVSPEQEMVQDLLTIVHCFSSRLSGLSNYRKALKKALCDATDSQNPA